MAKRPTEHYAKLGPMQFTRHGLHFWSWAWQRGERRPVAKVFFGWRFRFGFWLGRDDDGDVMFSAALFFVTYDLVVTTWPDVPSQLHQWAALDQEAS